MSPLVCTRVCLQPQPPPRVGVRPRCGPRALSRSPDLLHLVLPTELMATKKKFSVLCGHSIHPTKPDRRIRSGHSLCRSLTRRLTWAGHSTLPRRVNAIRKQSKLVHRMRHYGKRRGGQEICRRFTANQKARLLRLVSHGPSSLLVRPLRPSTRA